MFYANLYKRQIAVLQIWFHVNNLLEFTCATILPQYTKSARLIPEETFARLVDMKVQNFKVASPFIGNWSLSTGDYNQEK